MKPLFFKSYIELIKNSENSTLFKSFYWEKDDWTVFDILDDWDLSCAFYVSSILKIFNLVNDVHLTVNSTIKDMFDNWWKETEVWNLPIWSVILWNEREFDDWVHTHVWFYLWDWFAISNDLITKQIKKHSYNYDSTRNISKVFFNDKLNDKYYIR